ncbi:MAG: hypothetical protein EZS28_006864 [Streblomastix strix]|uniref:Uncharacterized protein n=1 Tax=Streblomastix strix TaxID=222440 RepID=A0A5J4WS34_9EUKA|nr:MAG: hypothetical protein EZS28_006864 [Streblomastix strix]
MKLTAQQVINMIRSKPEIMSPEWARDISRNLTSEAHQTAFLPFFYQLQQQSQNPNAQLNPFYNKPPQEQMQGQQPLQYLVQFSRQQMLYQSQLILFPAIPPTNPFLPTMNPPQTQISEPQLRSNENVNDQQTRFNMFNMWVKQQRKQLKDLDKMKQQPEMHSIYQFYLYLHFHYIQPLEYDCYLTQQREINYRDRVKDQFFSTQKETDESEDEYFLDEIMPEITMPHFQSHNIDIETAQQT